MNANQDPNSGKRMMLSLVLVIVLVLAFNFFTTKKETPKENSETKKAETVKKEAKNQNENKQDIKKEEDKKQEVASKKNATDDKKVVKEEPKQEVFIQKETDNYILVFSSKQAILKKIVLKKFFHNEGKPIEISPKIETGASPLLYKLNSFDTAVDFQVKEQADGSIVFSQETEKFRLEKIYTMKKDSYDIGLKIRVTNLGKERFKTKASLIWGTGLGPFIEDENKQGHYDKELVVSYYDRTKEKEVKIESEVVKKDADIDWIGSDNRYFFVALIPDKAGRYELALHNEDKLYDETISLTDQIDIDPGKVYEKSFTVYMGTKDEKLLKPYNRNLESVTERGWFALITLIGKGIKWLLFQIYYLVGNFGIAIIILSLILKIVLHPLSKKSMDSMKKMQSLQPQIKALKEKYKDPKELNAKTWELYRKNKINPAGGCLPLILQMPFFFALYQVLPYIVELKNVNFLWIKDFSSPDTVAYIEAFKEIPILPYQLNILPLILVVLSFIQTKMQAGGGNTGQGKMMEYMMPLIFLFIFWSLPSGLVLYWIVQTLFTIVQQYIVTKTPGKKSGKDNGEDKSLVRSRVRKPLSRKS